MVVAILFEFFPDLADVVEHLFGQWRNPVAQVVFNLPESAPLIKIPDYITEYDYTGTAIAITIGNVSPR